MRYSRSIIAAGIAALPLAFAAPAQAEETVQFTVDEMNGSGASATATITATDNGGMHVSIQGSGFTPNMPHAQHIHGAASGNFFCPTQAADQNGDGQVATEEGVAQYGNVFVSLTTKGDVSADSGLAVNRMPAADASGNLNYERTIPASMLPAGAAENLQNLHIVQHGLDVNGNDKYDFKALGPSVFAKSLGLKGVQEEATNPATCGEVAPAGGVDTGADSTTGVEQLPLMAFGGAALAGAAGTFWLRRRFAEAS